MIKVLAARDVANEVVFAAFAARARPMPGQLSKVRTMYVYVVLALIYVGILSARSSASMA